MSIIGDALKLTTIPQRLLLGGLAVSLLAAGTYNVVQAIENGRLSAENGKLDTRINDPKTGYVVRLTQARTNTTTCTMSLSKQTQAIKDLGTKHAAEQARSQARYDAEYAARTRAEKSAAALLARKPQGATLQERVLDVDAQILGDLK